MLGRQIAACDPAVCSNDLPKFDVAGFGKIVRRARVECNGDYSDLCFYSYINNQPVPFCIAGRPYRVHNSKIENLTGVIYDRVQNSGGYWIQEYEWSYSSSLVHSFTGSVYKRPGTNTVICNNFNAVVMRYSYTASYYKIEYTAGVDTYFNWGSSYDNCCSPVETTLQAVSREPQVWFSTTGSTWGGAGTGVPTSISFYYKPVASSNKDGIVIQLRSGAIASGPWEASASGGQIILRNNSGTEYTFSGTLSAAATAISAAAGSTLFLASVPSGILGSVALVSDLKETEFSQINVASCSIGFPLILAGEKVPPSNISSSHFLQTFASGSCVSSVNLQYSTAVSQGEADTHEAYESWLLRERYPKFPGGFADQPFYLVDPKLPNDQLFIGCNAGFPVLAYNILDYWNESPGDSIRNYSLDSGTGLYCETVSWNLACSQCTNQMFGCFGFSYTATTGCGFPPANILTGAGGFFDCPPGTISWHGWNASSTITDIPVVTFETSMTLYGVWRFE